MVSFRWRDHSGNLGYRSPLDHVEACDNDRSCLLYIYNILYIYIYILSHWRLEGTVFRGIVIM